jgi:two-component system, cell cycle sensor histidine kinase and response regulator CckA
VELLNPQKLKHRFISKLNNRVFLDTLIVIVATAFMTLISGIFDIYELVHNLTRRFEHFEIDEMLLGVFFFTILLVWFSYRRWSDSRREVVKRITAEKESRRVEQQRIESMKLMAGSIAHNFNNLLAAVLGNIELSTTELLPDSKGYTYLQDAEKAAQNAAKLSGMMLTYVGQSNDKFESLNLTALIEGMELTLKRLTPEQITIRFQLARLIPFIEGASQQIQQVLINLLSNSYEAIDKNAGTITISTGSMQCDRQFFQNSCLDENQPEGEYVFLEIEDSGPGIEAENLNQIFDPYYTTKFFGRGLGLAAVLGVVRAHKGSITAKSKPGETIIRLVFPVLA